MSPQTPPSSVKKKSSASSSLLELILIVAVALGLALGIQAFLVKPYRIPSPSMVPTLVEGQRILVNRIGNRFGDPSVGDIVVFHPPAGAENGDQCGEQPAAGRGLRHADARSRRRQLRQAGGGGPGGQALDRGRPRHPQRQAPVGAVHPAVRRQGSDCDFPKTITVPADHYFMMGDNRGASDDSRFWGPVPRDWIIGNAFATYWPPKRIGLL